jgi:hypothetical protein
MTPIISTHWSEMLANLEMEPTLLTARAIMPPRRAAHFAR